MTQAYIGHEVVLNVILIKQTAHSQINQLKLTFFKAYIVVNVHHLSSGHVYQDIVKMTITKADDVSNH